MDVKFPRGVTREEDEVGEGRCTSTTVLTLELDLEGTYGLNRTGRWIGHRGE